VRPHGSGRSRVRRPGKVTLQARQFSRMSQRSARRPVHAPGPFVQCRPLLASAIRRQAHPGLPGHQRRARLDDPASRRSVAMRATRSRSAPPLALPHGIHFAQRQLSRTFNHGHMASGSRPDLRSSDIAPLRQATGRQVVRQPSSRAACRKPSPARAPRSGPPLWCGASPTVPRLPCLNMSASTRHAPAMDTCFHAANSRGW